MSSLFIPHQLTAHTKFLHKIALRFQQQILILKRNDTAQSRPNCWDLPGGNSEWPKDLKKSASNLHLKDIVREVKEEIGIKLNPDYFDFKRLSYLSSYYSYPKQIYTVITGWSVLLTKLFKKKPEIKLSSEHSNYQWITLKQLDEYNFGGHKGQFVKDIIKRGFLAK